MPYGAADSLSRHLLSRPLFNLVGKVTISRRLAIGNLAEQIPDEAAEPTALRCQGQRHDSRHPPGKIIIQPVRRLAQDSRILFTQDFPRQGTITILLPFKPGPDQRRITSRQNHRAQRRLIHHFVVHLFHPLSTSESNISLDCNNSGWRTI